MELLGYSKAVRVGGAKMQIVQCTIFTNGMVMAFDDKGEQITECQGFILDVAEKLSAYCDKDTKWEFCKWMGSRMEADFSWWWERRAKSSDKV